MPAKIYDVAIIGSGAAGGTLSAHLARSGADVIVLEGGPKVDTRTAFNTHALPYQFPNRHIPTMKPGVEGFDSERSRGLGGKTQLWNAVALRMSPRDFKGYRHDSAGADWPIDYADLAPHYDAIEREVGVCGNLDHLPDLPDGIFLPPVPMKCSDQILARGAASLGVKIIHVRKATRSTPAPRTQWTPGRPACHFCGNCMAGCDVVAKYNSYDVHMIPALKTGKLTLQPNSIVYDIPVSKENRVTGVKFLDRTTKQPGEIQARIVVVAAACAQSASILLMSKSALYPTGLANSSGHLGQDFIPHFTGGVQVFLKDLIGKPSANDEGFLDHAYIPSFMHDRPRDYARSFGVQFNYQNRRAAGWAKSVPGFGKDFKHSVKDRYPAFVVLSPYGEMLPNKDSFVDLDYTKKDDYGLPLTRRTVSWKDNDQKLFKEMTRWVVDIAKASGAEILSVADTPATNHELGGCRAGSDPRTSVVNANLQSHDIPNLYVVDGSVFPSASEKNPTHTIMALAARLAVHIKSKATRGELA